MSLHWPSVAELAQLLEQDEDIQGTLALALSLNQIEGTWEEVDPVIATLLKRPLAQNFNLSLNYLPALKHIERQLISEAGVFTAMTQLGVSTSQSFLVSLWYGLLDTKRLGVQVHCLQRIGKPVMQ